MAHLIDRRPNPREKSLGNRQRFLRRSREEIKRAVDKAVNERNISDAGNGGSISIPSRGITEPRFRLSPQHGNRQRVTPGNKEFVSGDTIAKPPSGGGGSGKDASDSGEGEDDFVFSLSRSEFLDILFDDLELPDLIKSSLKDTTVSEPRRAGYSNDGTTPNLNVLRTMRNSIGRRLALNKGGTARLKELEAEADELCEREDLDISQRTRLAQLYTEIEDLKRRGRRVPFIDPIDIRYNRFERRPVPATKAVMFCLMDVSASMGEHEKDLAKRFFVLLHLFLQRQYERVEIVFIRHTHIAQEVSEEEFFYGRESGGTMVSAALETMLKIQNERYATSDWNAYVAQASDGDNFSSDTVRCVGLLEDTILPACQFYAYIEILTEAEVSRLALAGNPGKELWRGYDALKTKWTNFSSKHVASRADIYPVFRELFARRQQEGHL
ncbi:MAG: YeaH/YhbH family protein [Hyphomicrobiales bacterium]|nr:YeaH/YhbH family protein [Hyphomicrobiales bacterium]